MSRKTPEEQASERYIHAAFVADPSIEQTHGWEQLLRGYESERIEAYATCIREKVEPLEAERDKLRALVQVLVDGVGKLAHRQACALAQSVIGGYTHHPDCNCGRDHALNSAKELGFVPTNTTEG